MSSPKFCCQSSEKEFYYVAEIIISKTKEGTQKIIILPLQGLHLQDWPAGSDLHGFYCLMVALGFQLQLKCGVLGQNQTGRGSLAPCHLEAIIEPVISYVTTLK